MRLAVMICLVLSLSVGLAACGKKRPLTPPDGATYPRTYPNAEHEHKQ